MIICTNCKASHDQEQQFCSVCGEKLIKEQVVSTEVTEAEEMKVVNEVSQGEPTNSYAPVQPFVTTQKQSIFKKKWFLISSISAVAVIAIAVIVTLVFSNSVLSDPKKVFFISESKTFKEANTNKSVELGTQMLEILTSDAKEVSLELNGDISSKSTMVQYWLEQMLPISDHSLFFNYAADKEEKIGEVSAKVKANGETVVDTKMSQFDDLTLIQDFIYDDAYYYDYQDIDLSTFLTEAIRNEELNDSAEKKMLLVLDEVLLDEYFVLEENVNLSVDGKNKKVKALTIELDAKDIERVVKTAVDKILEDDELFDLIYEATKSNAAFSDENIEVSKNDLKMVFEYVRDEIPYSELDHEFKMVTHLDKSNRIINREISYEIIEDDIKLTINYDQRHEYGKNQAYHSDGSLTIAINNSYDDIAVKFEFEKTVTNENKTSQVDYVLNTNISVDEEDFIDIDFSASSITPDNVKDAAKLEFELKLNSSELLEEELYLSNPVIKIGGEINYTVTEQNEKLMINQFDGVIDARMESDEMNENVQYNFDGELQLKVIDGLEKPEIPADAYEL